MSGRHRRDRQLPPHVQDQLDAASQETRIGLEAFATELGVEVEEGTRASDPSAEALADEFSELLLAGLVERCPHVGTMQPMFVRAWDSPMVMRCSWCEHTQPPALNEVLDNTCDVCGRYDPTGIWPSQMAKGPVTLMMGRCDDCVPAHVRERGKQ